MAGEGFQAGSIFVSLVANAKAFTEGLQAAASKLTAFGKEVGGMATKITAFGKQMASAMLAPVRAVGSLVSSLFTLKSLLIALVASQAFKLFVTGPAEAAVELERMAARAGIAADQLERLQFVVKAAGGRGDDVSTGLEKLNRILEDARRGSEDFLPVLRELGFEGLSLSQIIDKVLTNPNLGAAGLKKLGVSELAVLTKLSREEVDKLLVSFVKLGNGTDSELFKLGNRLQVVKTQLAEAFGNVAEQVTKLILPHLLDALEAIEKFIENHMPEILAFFDTLGQQVGLFFDAVKKTAEVPEDLAFALQQSVEAIFEAIGNIALSSLEGIFKIGIESFKAFGAAIIILFGPFFMKLWEVLKIQLDFVTTKAGLFIRTWFEKLLSGFTTIFRAGINTVLEILAGVVAKVAIAVAELPDAIVPDGTVDNLLGVMSAINAARRANTAAVAEDLRLTAEQLAELNQQEVDAAKLRDQQLRNLADSFQGMSDETTKFALDLFIANCAEIAKQTKQTVKEITGEVLGAIEAVGNAFGFKLSGVGAAFDANLAKRQAEQKKQLQEQQAKAAGGAAAGGFQGPALPPGFIDTTSPAAMEALSKQLEENDKEAARIRAEELAKSEAALNAVIGGLFSGIHSAFNQIFIEGKSTLEALGDVAAQISDKFIGSTLEKLQSGLSKGLAAAFNDPKVGGAIADLAGAVIGIAATVFSIFQSKGKSKKSFSGVDDIVNSSRAVRGVVAGPESVAIAAVGEDLQRAISPLIEIGRAQLSALFGIRDALGGKGRSSDMDFVSVATPG